MATCLYQNENVLDLGLEKARVGLQAISFAAELGFSSITLEGDCLSFIKKINEEEVDRSNISMIIQEIKHLALRFLRLTYTFINRSANQAAHTMTMEGKQWLGQNVWIEEVPNKVEIVVLIDWQNHVL